MKSDLNHFRKRATQQFLSPFNAVIQVQRHKFGTNFPTDRQELAGQLTSFFNNFLDFRKGHVIRVPFRLVQQGQLGIPEDDLQDVVKIMGNTAGKRSQRFHFVSQQQLLLQLLLADNFGVEAADLPLKCFHLLLQIHTL